MCCHPYCSHQSTPASVSPAEPPADTIRPDEDELTMTLLEAHAVLAGMGGGKGIRATPGPRERAMVLLERAVRTRRALLAVEERDRRKIAHALMLLDEIPYEDDDAQDAIQAVRAVLAGNDICEEKN